MTPAPLIPTEDFFENPAASGATISPDGTRIAYLAPEKGRLNVWVRDLDGTEAGCVTHDHRRGIYRYQWTDDPGRLLYHQDTDGDENEHLYRVDLDSPDADAVDLTPFPGVKVGDASQPAGLPGTVFVTMNRRRPDVFDVHRIDLATGEISLVAQNPGHLGHWFWGSRGELFATTIPPGGGMQLLAWDAGSGTSRLLAAFDGLDVPVGVGPLQVTPDGTGLWVGSNRDQDHTRLVRVDVATGEQTVVDSHPGLDLDPRSLVMPSAPPPLILSRRGGALLGVRYLGERQVIHPLDHHFAEVLGELSLLSDGDLAGVSSDEDGRHWIVSFTHDTDPGSTYHYDHETGESRELFRLFPHLDQAALAPMTPVAVTSRDGWTVPCHLTLPVGVEPAALPMVVLLHGGPWFRDSWGFNPQVQFLANRGYAVLQVNMRGSTGYGKAFMRAAVHEFAGAMHDDVIDAVTWAVQEGYADPGRVGVFGRSYGGYATLVGVTFTPDVFAAAVDDCGMSSLPELISSFPPYVRNMIYNNWYCYVGDPEVPEQYEDMLARSPITRVDRIRTPLMVVQGARDVRVLKEQSDAIVAALRERGVDVEYLVKDDEGHGFRNPENLIDMYDGIERFLARQLGGRRVSTEAKRTEEAL